MNRQHLNQAIAYLVSAIRAELDAPQWDRPGIEAILAKLDDRPLSAVAAAAILAAATRPDQNTPAVIAMSGPHWRSLPSYQGTPQPPQHETSGTRLPDDLTAEYAARARAAIRKAGQ